MKKLAVLLLVAAMVLALCAPAAGSQATLLLPGTPLRAQTAPLPTAAPASPYEFTFGTVDTEEHPSTHVCP